jgi:hypothetical protein
MKYFVVNILNRSNVDIDLQEKFDLPSKQYTYMSNNKLYTSSYFKCKLLNKINKIDLIRKVNEQNGWLNLNIHGYDTHGRVLVSLCEKRDP